MSEAPLRGFDCIRFVREVRARNDEETKDMSWEEYRRWLDSRRPTGPRLAAAWDRAIDPREAARRAAAARAAERRSG